MPVGRCEGADPDGNRRANCAKIMIEKRETRAVPASYPQARDKEPGLIESFLRVEIIVVMIATLVAAFVRGMAGFGAALILTPVFATFFGPAVAVPTLGLVDLIVATPMGVRAVRRSNWREILPLAVSALLALPFGVWMLTTVPDVALRIAMSIFILLAVTALWTGWRYKGQPGMGATLAVGAVSGVTTGAIGMGGPPVVLFWLGGQNAAAQARTNTLAFFAVTGIGSFANYLYRGLFTDQVLVFVALLLPVYATGLYLGSRAFRILPERIYRRIAFSLVAATALVTLIAAVVSLVR